MVGTERIKWYDALYFIFGARCILATTPIRHHFTLIVSLCLTCAVKYIFPAIRAIQSFAELLCHLLTYCKALISVYSAFALFKIYWIGRKVPMYDLSAVVMEVQPLLPYGSSCEQERLEGRIERRPYIFGTLNGVIGIPRV